MNKMTDWIKHHQIAAFFMITFAITWRNAYNFRAAIDVCVKPFCDFATFYYPMEEAIFQIKLPIGLLGGIIEYRRKT